MASWSAVAAAAKQNATDVSSNKQSAPSEPVKEQGAAQPTAGGTSKPAVVTDGGAFAEPHAAATAASAANTQPQPTSAGAVPPPIATSQATPHSIPAATTLQAPPLVTTAQASPALAKLQAHPLVSKLHAMPLHAKPQASALHVQGPLQHQQLAAATPKHAAFRYQQPMAPKSLGHPPLQQHMPAKPRPAALSVNPAEMQQHRIQQQQMIQQQQAAEAARAAGIAAALAQAQQKAAETARLQAEQKLQQQKVQAAQAAALMQQKQLANVAQQQQQGADKALAEAQQKAAAAQQFQQQQQMEAARAAAQRQADAAKVAALLQQQKRAEATKAAEAARQAAQQRQLQMKEQQQQAAAAREAQRSRLLQAQAVAQQQQQQQQQQQLNTIAQQQKKAAEDAQAEQQRMQLQAIQRQQQEQIAQQLKQQNEAQQRMQIAQEKAAEARARQQAALQQMQMLQASQGRGAVSMALQPQKHVLAGKSVATPAVVAKPVAAAKPLPAQLQITPQYVPPPLPPAKPLPWVDQLSKMSLLPWATVHRPWMDLKQRWPTLTISPDLLHVDFHFAAHGSASRLQLSPPADAFRLTPTKDVLVPQEKPSTPAVACQFRVRVALLAGKFLEEATHSSNKLHFVVLNNALPEGRWVLECDGPNPQQLPTMKKTAVRCMKELLGIDLSGCDFHHFMDICYRQNDDMEIQCAILIPEIWGLPAPLELGRQVKEIDKEFKKMVMYEEDVPEEEIQAQRKLWQDRIAQERAQGMIIRIGEREVDRVERLEQLEERLQQMERNPDIKTTRTHSKQVTEVQKVPQEVGRPSHLSLAKLISLSQGTAASPNFDATFETKLFALCFDDMLRLDRGLQIVDWLHLYQARSEEELAVRQAKKKRERDEVQEAWARMQDLTRARQERAVKRQKLEQKKRYQAQSRARAALEKARMRESDRAEQEMIEKEQATMQKELEGEMEEDLEEEAIAPMPTRKATKLVYTLDEAMQTPFLYFDTSPGAAAGTVSRTDLLRILHCAGELCYRDAQELLLATQKEPPPGQPRASPELFGYRQACCIQSEVEVLPQGAGKDAGAAPNEAAAAPVD